MKLIPVIICLNLFLGTISAQNNTYIRGKITNSNSSEVYIQLTDANKNVISVSDSINENGEFDLAFRLDGPAKGMFSNQNEYTNIYVEPGDELFLSLNTEKFDETLNYTGKGAANNNFLATYFLRFLDSEYISPQKAEDALYVYNPLQFLAYSDSLSQAKKTLFDEFAAKNALSQNFTEMTKEEAIYEQAILKLQYASSNQSFQDSSEAFRNNFLEFANKIPLTCKNPLVKEKLRAYIDNYIPLKFKNIPQQKSEISACITITKMLKEILPQEIAYDYIFEVLASSLQNADSDSLKTILDDFYLNCKNEEQINELKRIQEEAKLSAEGAVATDFCLSDVKGKKVKLSDFKGKVVLLDFWATWCGPCIEEIPAAKALREKFKKNKNIEFVYICINSPDEDWKKVIKENKLKGVQLLDTEETQTYMYYGIKYIPSFILIGKDGKIAKNPAKRPSDPELIQQIEELLNR